MAKSILDSATLEGVRVELASISHGYKRDAENAAKNGNFHQASIYQSQSEGYGMACLFLARKIGVDDDKATRAVFLNDELDEQASIFDSTLSNLNEKLRKCAEAMECNDPTNYRLIFGTT